jgi:UDP-N-acetylmuramoyl-L-alanyl-D-glutamate--2,6-diaminopimelate ligase
VPFPGPTHPAASHRLAELAAVAGAPVPPGAGDVRVTGACLDSRAVRPGDLYAALPGARTHGARFAGAAAEAGAVALLTDAEGVRLAAGTGLPALVVPDPRAVLGAVAARVHGDPGTRLRMYGVTGTNGKTTTTYLLDGALRQGGRTTGLVGTVETRVGDETLPSIRTTPEATDLQALLALMVERGVAACSMEVSSHALALHRVDGVVFDVAGFTNLSQDHLDFHPTMAEYFAAKAELFTPARARHGVVCVDDEWGRLLAGRAREAGVPVTTVATLGGSAGAAAADWTVTDRRVEGGGTGFTLAGPDGARVAARCPLPGDFNVANTAVALLVLVVDGVPAAEAAGWLAAARPVPGRMEPVRGAGLAGEPLAVVDYAHSPDAITAAAEALRAGRDGPLVVVLGAGGDRDREKRPLMGAAAAAAADVVVVTDDNPRGEDPAAIRRAVLAGARPAAAGTGATVLEVGDRAAAIEEGVRRAWGGGTLLVAGKGHETGQEIAGVVHPFDDRTVLARALLDPGPGAGPGPATGPGPGARAGVRPEEVAR